MDAKNDEVESTDDIGIKEADDDNLDDFFAKKDKGKKNKKKKKYITTEALAKTLERINMGEEEETKKVTKKEKEGTDGTKGVNNNDVEEWHEYEDESQRDYSDLKIQNFQISDKKAVEVVEPQYNEEGELIPPTEEEGPWRNVPKDPNAPVVEPPPMRKMVSVDTPSEPAEVKKSVYRPPHARLSGPGDLTPTVLMPMRRRRQEAPAINSEIDFPTLSGAVRDTEQHVGFETVKSGAKSISRSQQEQQQQASQAPSLILGNKFAALRD